MPKNSPRKSFLEIAPSYLGGVAAVATATITVLAFMNGRDEASESAPVDRSGQVAQDAAAAGPGPVAAPESAVVDGPVVAQQDAAVSPAVPKSSVGVCRRIVGTWQWYTGEVAGVLTFAEDQQVGASVARGVAPVLLGSWSCDESSGAYTIRWQNNVVERVALADDGRTASGSNNMNMPIRGSALPD